MRDRLAALGIGAVVALTITACGSDAPHNEPARHPLVGSSWRLDHVKDSHGDVDIPPSVAASLTIDANTIAGRDGCNALAAGYSRAGDRLTLRDPRSSTQALCTLTDRAHNAALAAVDAVMRANGPDRQTHQPVRASVSGDELTVSYGDIVTLRLSYAGPTSALDSPSSTASRSR